MPPGLSSDSDLSRYITSTDYYPIRRTVGRTTNYVPSFIDPPLPKPKPFRKYPKRRLGETKKLHSQRKVVRLSDNTPKTVKLNGYEAPAILPRPKPRQRKYIITKKGYKDIENTSSNSHSGLQPNLFPSSEFPYSHLTQAEENYEGAKRLPNNIKSSNRRNRFQETSRIGSNLPYENDQTRFQYNDFYV